MNSDTVTTKLTLPMSECHFVYQPNTSRKRSNPDAEMITKYRKISSGSSKVTQEDSMYPPTKLIYLSLTRRPSLTDVSDDVDANPGVYLFKRGAFKFNMRLMYNPFAPSQARAGYLWKKSQTFIDALKQDSNRRTEERTAKQVADPRDLVVNILKENVELDQKHWYDPTLSWVTSKKSELGLTDEDFLLETVYTQTEYEEPEPITRIPDEYKPRSTQELLEELKTFAGFTLADFHVPLTSSKAPVGSILWPVNRPYSFFATDSYPQEKAEY
ncbi:uncharacterized protein L199_002080 [Kwoniella botswanensis]|uniref:uncharacterized protein n=1 Tax=Kwoniella botswanensis TaxID=1268659 RepID=UPI00315C5DF7